MNSRVITSDEFYRMLEEMIVTYFKLLSQCSPHCLWRL